MLISEARFSHLADPQNAYMRLLGILGKPVVQVQVQRLAHWMNAPTINAFR